VINGGFDPAPFASLVGDTVAITVSDPQGRVVASWQASVKRRPPVIVRTEPPPRKRDVPLNMSLLVVFSEPVDPATVTDRTVRLFDRNGLPMPGQLWLDPDGLRAVLRPHSYLSPNSSYTLDITAGVTGLSGIPLATPQQVVFTTGDKQAGVLRVITTTTFLSPDPEGYRVIVDADTSRAMQIGAPDTLSLSIGQGIHTVAFMGSAPNCVVMKPTWSGSVEAALATTVRVPISCSNVPRTGVIVEVSTTGVDLDDAYTLSLCSPTDCQSPNPIDWRWGAWVMANTARLVETPIGTYWFLLSDVAANCSGPTSGVVTVVDGQFTTLRPEIVCGPASTLLRVTARSSGPAAPPAYVVNVDVRAGASVAAGGSLSVNLSVGRHDVSLAIPFNCSVLGSNTRTVDLAQGATTDVVFDITCQMPGTLLVFAPTDGSSPDDSYLVTLDGFYHGTMLANSFVTFMVPSGIHTIDLGDIAPNCTLAGPNPVAVSVEWGETRALSLPVTCVSSP
jgi:hypothetical protein